MNTKLIFGIAKSLLLARLGQTLVAAVGVTFSIAMFITLLSFMNGLNDLLDGLILNRTPHVRLYNEIKPSENQPVNESPEYANSYNFISSVKSGISRQEIYNSGPIIQAVKTDPRVVGVAPKLTTQVFFNEGTIDITGVINGVDVEEEMRLFNFQDYVTAGSAIDAKNVANSIILGKGLADILVADIGDVVQVTTVEGERFPLKVVGYFQSGIQEIDKVQSYASIVTTQKLEGKPANYITDIQVKLQDLKMAPAVAQEYRQKFDIDAEDIQTANAQFETGSNIRTIISYAVGVTLLVVAGFGIFNILNMMIYEKMDSIAILKATGFSGRDVNRVFLLISMSIGFFGGMVGLVFGFIFSVIIDNIPFNTAALPTIKTYPVDYSPVFYFIGGTFSLITTYLAGFFPARKASRVDPVEIIRGK
ncbi:ABC transporter permease [Pontibacter ruber]|uniref:ABC transporter permease n=1 Tax=Pontibacter ruber TaxID=1343895 RepID=A0ABW5CT78_9BACT|nr:FtsX-like permease family protein [Pontibacter ruber]